MEISNKRPPKHTRNYKTHFTSADRDYDPALDGWDVHKLRKNPTVDELLYRKQTEYEGLEDGF